MPQTTILLGSVLLEIMSNGFILKPSFQQHPPLPEIFISICWEVTEKAQGECDSLPRFPSMTAKQNSQQLEEADISVMPFTKRQAKCVSHMAIHDIS